MAIQANLEFRATARHTLENGVAAANNAQVLLAGYNNVYSLNANTSPPVTKAPYFLLTLSGGAATINLAALTDANGACDLTGLRVQMLHINNLGANAMTFAEGASNGIALACGTIVVPAGGEVMIRFNDASPDVASGDRTIDVTGTGTQTAEISIWAG